jgi:hypothetical protein
MPGVEGIGTTMAKRWDTDHHPWALRIGLLPEAHAHLSILNRQAVQAFDEGIGVDTQAIAARRFMPSPPLSATLARVR